MSRLWGVLALAPLGLGVVGLLQCGLDGPGTAVPDDGSAPPADATIDALDGTSPPDAGDSSVGSDGGVDASCVGIDASGDPKNCGACGHDCFGGACKAGACQPATVSTNEDVVALALDAVNLYWLNQGNGGLAERCPLTGCVPEASTTWAQVSMPRGLALDTQNAYWSINGNPGRVERATKNGPLIDAIGPNQYTPGPVVADDAYVYWTAQGTLTRVAKDGGAPTTLSPGQIGPLALAKGTIFWSSNNAVHACAAPDCDTVTDLTMLDQPSVKAIAADDTYAYWVRADSILRCATAGCGQNPTLVGKASTLNLTALALDATDVYFGTDAGGIGRCSKTGCGVNPTMLVSGNQPVTSMAVDSTAIYWSLGTGGGGVRKLAK